MSELDNLEIEGGKNIAVKVPSHLFNEMSEHPALLGE